MVARITYRRRLPGDGDGEPSGNAVTVAEGAPAEAVYRRDPRWIEVDRVELEAPAEPERAKPAERAEAQAAALEAEAEAHVAKLVDAGAEQIAAGNVGEVKAAVTAGGPELAVAVLEAERSGRNRSSLVSWLIGQAGDLLAPEADEPSSDEGEPSSDDVEPDVDTPTY